MSGCGLFATVFELLDFATLTHLEFFKKRTSWMSLHGEGVMRNFWACYTYEQASMSDWKNNLAANNSKTQPLNVETVLVSQYCCMHDLRIAVFSCNYNTDARCKTNWQDLWDLRHLILTLVNNCDWISKPKMLSETRNETAIMTDPSAPRFGGNG